TTTNPNANQGHSGGAQISLVTKGGSNEWTGSVFEFYRSKGLAANDFFNNRAGSDPVTGKPKVPTPQLIRHNFSVNVGGPIIKNRAFFFYSYEGRRQLSQTSVVRTVPLPSLGLGQLRYRSSSGNIVTLTTAQLNADRKSTRLNSSHVAISYAVFCLKKK